jgi:hypothetical protein
VPIVKSVAEATSKSEQIRSEGDATRNQIFADAFKQDFFAFYRSMQTYEHGLKSNDTRMLLTPEARRCQRGCGSHIRWHAVSARTRDKNRQKQT